MSKKRFDRGLEHNFFKCKPYGIELNTEDALDLVFLIDGSCSKIDEEGFEWGLDFSTELVRTIGLSQRYDNYFFSSQIQNMSQQLLADTFDHLSTC